MKTILYSTPLDNEDRAKNETSIYRCPKQVGKDWLKNLPISTIHDCFKKNLEKPNNKMFGYRAFKKNSKVHQDKFTWLTVKEIFQRAEKIGSGLINLNLAKEINEWKNYKLRFVGIYSKNTLNYFLSDIGSCLQGVTIVPIYDTLGEEATEFAFAQTKMTTCFISANHVAKMLENKENKGLFKNLENLVILDYENFDEKIKSQYEDIINIYDLTEIERSGEQNLLPWAKVTPDSIYAFSYTSGTTGTPKGAMLSHQNICSTVIASYTKINMYSSDVYISYLPLAHVMERIFYLCMMYFGAKIGIYSGDITKITEDLKILKPTIFVSVPRLYNKMYDKIQKGIALKTGFIKKIINSGIESKLENLRKHGKTSHWFYDLIVFKKMKAILGGRVRIMAVGSAPISTEVLDFLKIAFCAPIVEGYGQTEALAFEFATNSKDGLTGHVGGPFPHNEFKLVDVPEMNYTNHDKNELDEYAPRGEIWVRGANVIPGYYKLDKKNAETFTKDGWLLSGDIGMIMPKTNALKIIDRKKNIFKLAQGEYIAPEKLESIYKAANPLISDMFVYGDSLKSCLVAVMSIEKPSLVKLATELNVADDFDLENNVELNKKVLELFVVHNKENKLNSLEKIKGLIIDTTPWADLDLITNTFKKKRIDLKNYYLDRINTLYEKLY